MMEDLFNYHYYTPSLPSAFSGVNNLRRGLKQSRQKTPSKRETLEWLSGEDAYTLHKPTKSKFKRRKTIVNGPGYQLQADLIDVRRHARDNNGHTFILTAIDVFSRKGYATPLKDKTGPVVSKGLEPILLQATPKALQTDKGKEFLNQHVERVLNRFNVHHFTSENENVKASLVERFNRTLRNVLHRHFTKTGRERFLDILPDALEAYNNRSHEALGTSPNDVSSESYEDIWLKLYNPQDYFERRKAHLVPGDSVRISKARGAFKRGFTENWSRELFYIEKILQTSPITYRIRDWKGESIRGSFYKDELQKVREPSEYKIEKILRRKKVRGKWMVLVKWIGYSEEFNQWIPESDVRDT